MTNHLYKKNNRGAALVSILIAVTFITIIATSLLYISASNYRMKVANGESKKNFYRAEGEMMTLTSKLRSELTSPTDPMLVLDKYMSTDKNHYDCAALASILDPDPLTNDVTVTKSGDSLANVNYKKNDNDFYQYDLTVKSSNNEINYYKYDSAAGSWSAFNGTEMNNGLYKVVFKDVVFAQTSQNDNNSAYDYFENTIKSDIVVQISRTSQTKEVGGIGDFSILMDDQLLINGADFSTMNIYGNSMTANYEFNPGLGYTTPINSNGDGSKAALSLKGDNRVNIMGDYFVVFGDIVIDQQSSLYLNGTNLMVYGNIYIKDQGALICSNDSTITMVGVAGNDNIATYSATDISNSTLPGYSTVTDIICTDGNMAKHLLPQDKVVKRLNKADSYDQYASLMRFTDGDKTNDGILTNILNKENNAAAHKINVQDISDKKTISTDYYDEKCNIVIDKQSTQNGGMKDSLVFFTYDPDAAKKNWSGAPDYVLMQESNINSTIISTAPLNVDQKHTITLSKIGPEKFDWLTLPHDTDSYKKTPAVHDFEIVAKPNGGGEVKTKVSAGDFFTTTTIGDTTYDPNSLVKALLGCSSEQKDNQKPKTQTSMYLENWSKDL